MKHTFAVMHIKGYFCFEISIKCFYIWCVELSFNIFFNHKQVWIIWFL